MTYKLIITVLGVLLALVTLNLAASPSASSMGYTLSAPLPMLLKWVPGGDFHMGDLSGVGQEDERPVRTVSVPGFWMMSTEVTMDMFQRFVAATGHTVPAGCSYFSGGWKFDEALSWRAPGFVLGPDHPVTCVSWHDARAFADWLSLETGMTFNLPSEAQWEFAARAGTRSRYSFGDDPALLCKYANGADRRSLADYPDFDANDCDDGYTRTAPVGSYPANAWGLHDLTGNVWEWVADCWSADYAAMPLDGSARDEGDCGRRGYRGGAYGDVPFFLRIALRNRGNPAERKDDVGFRVVLSRWD